MVRYMYTKYRQWSARRSGSWYSPTVVHEAHFAIMAPISAPAPLDSSAPPTPLDGTSPPHGTREHGPAGVPRPRVAAEPNGNSTEPDFSAVMDTLTSPQALPVDIPVGKPTRLAVEPVDGGNDSEQLIFTRRPESTLRMSPPRSCQNFRTKRSSRYCTVTAVKQSIVFSVPGPNNLFGSSRHSSQETVLCTL